MKDFLAARWQRLTALVKRNPHLWGVFAVLWVVTLFPIWVPRFLPLLDLPNHIDAIAIWHRYYDPSWRYSEYYNLNLLPVPYWGYFFPVHMMSYLLPIEVANKVYLSVYALALPVGCALLAVRMGRSPWLSVFTWPLVFNMNFMFGFITCCAGMAVLPFCIVALDLYMEAPSRKRAVALFFAVMVLYFTHVLPWLYFGVGSIIILFSHGWHPRRILTAGALMLPSVFVAILGFHDASSAGNTSVKHGRVEFEAKWEQMKNLLGDIPDRLVTQWQSNDQGYWFVLIMGAIWLMIALTAEPDPVEERARPGYRYRLELLFLLAVLAIFKLPIYQKKPVDLWMVGGRFVAVSAMLGALLPRGPLSGKRKWLMVPVLIACVWYPLQLMHHWRRFDKRASGIRKLMAMVPRGSSTLTLVVGDYGDVDADPQAVPYIQFHSYAQLYGGGYNPWALSTGFPMVPKKDKKLPAPTWKQPHSFRMDEHGVHYDYVLTFMEPTDYALFNSSDQFRAPIVGKDGNWRLYQMMKNRDEP